MWCGANCFVTGLQSLILRGQHSCLLLSTYASQGQANRFIRRTGKATDIGFEVLKISDATFMRELELSIQLGKWVLIENVSDTLDPSLDPILLQQKTKSGSGKTRANPGNFQPQRWSTSFGALSLKLPI